MENSRALATESFSYSWLTDRKPQYSCPNNQTALSKNRNDREQNFKFDFPFSSSQIAPVHADEIFSGGHIMPGYVNRARIDDMRCSVSAPRSPLAPNPFVSGGNRSPSLEKLRKSPAKFFRDLFGFLKPVIGWSRKSSRVDDFERVRFQAGDKVDSRYGMKKVKSVSNSPQASPRISPSCSNDSWSCDVESSINEAILYCKRSIEK